MKTLDCIKPALALATLLGLTSALVSTGVADSTDYTVVVRDAQTVEQLVSSELQSAKFAKQIASYNGIQSATTVLAVGTTLAIPRPYMESLDFGRIVYVKGDVLHSQPDLVVNPPGKGAHIYNGDVLETGSDGFVSLAFNSGARVNLQPDSRVVVKDIDCVKVAVKCVIALSATKGQVHSEITPAADGQPPVKFSVETPFLSAAVRGTAFYVDLDGAENRIGVTKGLVATESSGAQNDLPRGKGLSAKPGVVAEVVDLLDPPVISAASDVLLVSREDTISWNSIDGASRYQANVANDSLMSESLFVQTTERQSFRPELSPGDYHLTVAAIDSKNFLGLPARKRISFAEISDPQQPTIQIVRRGRSVELSVPDYDGEAQLLIGKSIDSDIFTTSTLTKASEKIVLDLDEDQRWVFRARKILGVHQVSAYSDYYVLDAR